MEIALYKMEEKGHGLKFTEGLVNLLLINLINSLSFPTEKVKSYAYDEKFSKKRTPAYVLQSDSSVFVPVVGDNNSDN